MPIRGQSWEPIDTMIARQDNENLYLIYSDDLSTWTGGLAILQPQSQPRVKFSAMKSQPCQSAPNFDP